MIRGLYTAASGMLKGQKKLDVVTNNLANSSTTGYKRDIAVYQSFHEVLTKRINDDKAGQLPNPNIGSMSLGSDVVQVYTDFTQGRLIKTDKATDMSFKNSDSSFFAVSVPGEEGDTEMYTRNGSWTISEDGYLITREGYKAVGLYGPIYLASDEFVVQEDGSIYLDDEYIDTLKIVDFVDTEQLQKYGEHLVGAPDDAQIGQFEGQVAQGFIEGSNINTIEEMLEVITLMRSYEANQKVIKAYDESLGKIINEAGRI
ncbi:MAG: flagellar hook-basal body complex protein [Firmicutes bacterium]|nr:flagellar hook-basal body complex protein [Bacillota bacterium]